MFIKTKKPNYFQPHCKISILDFPTVGHSPSTVLFVSLLPRSSQRPSLDQRSSTCTRLSSTCSGSNTALCIIPTQECKNGTPSSPRGTCMSLGVYFCFSQNRTTHSMLALGVCAPSVSPPIGFAAQTDWVLPSGQAPSHGVLPSFVSYSQSPQLKTTIISSAWASSVNLRLQGHTGHLKWHKAPSGHLPATSDEQHVRVS